MFSTVKVLDRPEMLYKGRKPTGNLGINTANNLASGITHCYLMDSLAPVNIASGYKGFTGSSVTTVKSGDIVLPGNNYESKVDISGDFVGSEVTITAIINVNGLRDHGIIDIDGQTMAIWIDVNSSALRVGVFAGGVAYSTNNSITQNEDIVVSVSIADSKCTIFVNGQLSGLRDVYIGNRIWSDRSIITLGANQVGATKLLRGLYKLFVVHNRVLIDDEIESIADDPYKIVTPL